MPNPSFHRTAHKAALSGEFKRYVARAMRHTIAMAIDISCCYRNEFFDLVQLIRSAQNGILYSFVSQTISKPLTKGLNHVFQSTFYLHGVICHSTVWLRHTNKNGIF